MAADSTNPMPGNQEEDSSNGGSKDWVTRLQSRKQGDHQSLMEEMEAVPEEEDATAEGVRNVVTSSEPRSKRVKLNH